MSEATNSSPEKKKRKKQDRDGVYKRPDSPGYWISWTDHLGRRRRRRVNAINRAHAETLRANELIRADEIRTKGFSSPGEETFQEIATRFLSHQKARLTPKAYEREKGIVENHLSNFFTGKLSAIRRVDIQRYITKRIGEVSAHSVQKELNILKHLLSLSVEWEIIQFNPAQGIKPPKVPAGRVRYLQPSELKLLIESSPSWLQPIIALAVTTGMRRSEILNLRWLDVDMAHKRVLLPQTKNGDGRIVYLNRIAFTVLMSLQPSSETKPTDKLFPDITPNQVSVAFHRVCVDVEIADFRFHDLRHTAASWLRMQGADIHTVAQLLGHKDLRMAARYQHLSPAFLADAVGRLDEIFDEACHNSVTSPSVLTDGLAVNN